jgi:WD40-like Beta Propeller Repeat
MRSWLVMGVVAVAALALPAGAGAWVPGTEGPILFSSAEGAPSDAPGLHIWSVRPDGTGKRELTHGYDTWPSWAPDGRHFVFARAGLFNGPIQYHLFVADSSGGSLRQLTSPSVSGSDYQGDTHPTWSPDGAHIAFVRQNGPTVGIWVIDPDGNNLQQVADLAGSTAIRGLSWSPDSRNLLFQTAEPLGPGGSGSPDEAVYEMSADGADIHQALVLGQYLPGLDWSPAGVAVPTFTDGLRVVPLGASGTSRNFAGDGAIQPSWAPDATNPSNATAAYLTASGHGYEVFRASTGSQITQELTFDGFTKGSLSWGPGLPRFVPSGNGLTVKRPVEPSKPTIPVVIHCPGNAGAKGCLDRVTVSTEGHILTSAHLRLRAGRERTLTLRLTASARRKLHVEGRLSLVLISKVRGRTHRIRELTRVLAAAALTNHVLALGVHAGSAISVKGTLNALNGGVHTAAAGSKRVGVILIDPNGQSRSLVLNTSGTGAYSGAFTPIVAGTWIEQTVWNGDIKHAPTGSAVADFRVAPVATKLVLSCPGKASVKGTLTVTGAISPALGGALLSVIYSHAGTSIGHSVTAGSSGAFSDSITVNDAGKWDVQATFPGDQARSPSRSKTCVSNVS